MTTQAQKRIIKLFQQMVADPSFQSLPCQPRFSYGYIGPNWYDVDFWPTDYNIVPEAQDRIRELAYSYCLRPDNVHSHKTAFCLEIDKAKVVGFHEKAMAILSDGGLVKAPEPWSGYYEWWEKTKNEFEIIDITMQE